ncbi:Panacea domain-containing protein [Tropicimonas isoalkanivorans]|uniref:Panacea domain-containing protein n=1 Tax=Tropicimonas isoalkanivorans TaxID=441112 RepID=UPI000B8A2E80|nr:Panacea domain-containing protein [Tropicimonas isoalkanivorans]
MPYNPKKAAQTVAFFAIKNGRRINTLKAVKLVYLADRASIEAYGFPIQEERRVAMPRGPVNSTTYDYIKGEVSPNHDGGWSDVLTDREQHNVGLTDHDMAVDDLDELSDADVAVLERVWREFGHLTQWELVQWTHDPDNIPEWADPDGSSRTIPLEKIMAAVGVDNVNEAVEELNSASRAADFLRRL